MKKGLSLIAAVGVVALQAGSPVGDVGRYDGNPPSSYYVSAPVRHVDPIYTTRTIEQPTRHCSNETREVVHQHDYERRRSDENYFVPGLFGGVLGGLIGSRFGGGSGKKALTVIGALAGSSIARDAARRRHQDRDHYRTKVCRTTYETEVVEDISAYDVTYEYGGQQFSKRMSEHPGDSVRIRVQLEPMLTDG
jgi:uncharacterized protein YcfJ